MVVKSAPWVSEERGLMSTLETCFPRLDSLTCGSSSSGSLLPSSSKCRHHSKCQTARGPSRWGCSPGVLAVACLGRRRGSPRCWRLSASHARASFQNCLLAPLPTPETRLDRMGRKFLSPGGAKGTTGVDRASDDKKEVRNEKLVSLPS